MIPDKSLHLWNLPPATKVTLLAERENRVYRLDVPDESPTVLRIHRQDYHTDAELNSELQWVAHLAEQGMVVPQPISTVNGSFELAGGQAAGYNRAIASACRSRRHVSPAG